MIASLLWGLPACGVRVEESGIQAAVLYEVLAPGSRTSTDMGDLVAIREAEVSVRSVELLRCADDVDGVDDVDDVDETANGRAAALLAALGSRASAHTENTPTRLGIPITVALDPTAGPASPGVMLPPPGAYCGVRLMLGAPDEAPADSAARIAGQYLQDDTMVDFVRSTPLTATVDIDLPRLVLDSPNDAVEIWLSADSGRWLDSMALSSASPDDRVSLAEQVAASITVEVRWAAGAAP